MEDSANLERNEMLENNTGCSINVVRNNREDELQFESYWKEKFSHLNGFDAQVMSKMLRNNRDLVHKEGSRDIGYSSSVKHDINTGNAHPVIKHPYR